MKIVSVYNNKGGVGKTASAVNLAYMSSLDGYNTLIWDLDCQAATTFYFRLHPKIKGGAKKLISGKRDILDNIKGTDYPLLDILPSDDTMRHQDLLFDNTPKPYKRIKKLLSPLENDYDYIFIDCAPSMSLTSQSIFCGSDLLLVPTIPTTLSLLTLDKLHLFFKEHGLSTSRIKAFFSMVDIRRQLHKEITNHPPKKFSFAHTYIPYMSEIEKMGLDKQPACVTKGRARQCYQALWDELKTTILKLE